MAATRPDDEAWAQLGDWLRDRREAQGWTLIEVGERAPGRSVASRLRQIERGYNPDGYPMPETLRRIEIAERLQPGRLDTVLQLAQRRLVLPNPYVEPVVMPDRQPEPGPRTRVRRSGAHYASASHPEQAGRPVTTQTTSAPDRVGVHPVRAG